MSKGEDLLKKYEQDVEATWRAMTPKSRVLCANSENYTPGGALRSHNTGTYPAYAERVDGSYMYDVDGNRYLDLIVGMTSIFGHNHPKIAAAVREQMDNGLVSFMPDEGWDKLAQMMCERVPSVEKVWPAFGGSQAFMWAIRAARAYTKREKILRIWGGYHGSYDDAFAMPPTVSPGLPQNTLDNIIFCNWNDKAGTEQIIEEHKDEIAAVLTEGVQTGGTIPPQDGYLSFLRDITRKHGIVLIFDEIVNFWLDHGGTGALYDVKPDLCCYGKGIGGGLAMGMVGGHNDIMKLFDGREAYRIAAIAAHQGDPTTVAASTACLNIMTPDVIADINGRGERLAQGIRDILSDVGIRGKVIGYGNHQSVHLTAAETVSNPVEFLLAGNTPGVMETMALFRRSLINKGVLTRENLMALRVSTPVTDEELDFALAAMREGFSEVHPILRELAPQLIV